MAKKKNHTMKALNLPDELVELVQSIADREDRNFTSQTIRLLEGAAKDYLTRNPEA